MAKHKGIRIPPPHMLQGNLFEEPPILKPVLENTVVCQGRVYFKEFGKFYEYINNKKYEAFGEALLMQLAKIWVEQNTLDGKLFIEGEPNHQL